MATEQVKESLIKKIKALLDKANSTDSLPEKEAFMLGVQRLLQQHNIDIRKIENIETDDFSVKEDSLIYSDLWEAKLVHVIAVNNFCQTVRNVSDKKVNVIGRKENIEVVITMFQFFANSLLQLSVNSYNKMIEDAKKEYGIDVKKVPGHKEKMNMYLSDYMIGGVDGINAKMREQKQEEIRKNEKYNAVLRINDSAVQEYVSKKYPNLRKGKAMKRNDKSNGYNNGYKDGKSLSPHSNINSRNSYIRIN